MLVLSRKAEQKIQLGNTITITVLKVTGSVVRIGIEAPQGVRILRAELADKLRAGQDAEPASDATLATQSQAPYIAPNRLKLHAEETSRPEEPGAAESRPAQSRFSQRSAQERPAQSPPAGESRSAGPSARRVAPQSDSPRCRVPRAGFNSPGRHPLRVGPASVAEGMTPSLGSRRVLEVGRPWDGG